MRENVGKRLSSWGSAKSLEIDSHKRVKKNQKSKIKKSKIFYVVVFSILSVSCMITVYNAINDYLKYDVVSQTRIISDQPSLFPKITICSTVTFPTKKASDLIVKIVKRVFGQDLRNFKNFKNLSKIFSSDDFLSLLGIANVMTVSEVILNLN
jgi:hypothetical protein